MKLVPAVFLLLGALALSPTNALSADTKASVSWKALSEQSQVLYRQGDVERAIEVAQQALAHAKSQIGADSPEAAESMSSLAVLYRAQSLRMGEAAAQIRQQKRNSNNASNTVAAVAPPREVSSSAPSAGKSVDKLVFGLIAPRGAEQTTKNWQPFADAMSARLKIPVELYVRSDFKEIVEAFKQGKLDLAWVGNVGALEIVESGKGALFGRMSTKLGGTGYKATLIVHRDSKIQSIQDILKPNSGYVFGDGDVKSTSGHLVPLYYAFVQNKVNDPSTLFKEIKHSNHRTNLQMTAKREVDVATSNNEELEFFAKDEPGLHKQIRVIWTSPEIPHSPLLWRRSLASSLKRQIMDFVTNFGKTEAERDVLTQANGLTGIGKSSNRQLVTVANLEMFNAHRKLWNDRELSPDDRKRKELELSKRGARLEIYLRATEEY